MKFFIVDAFTQTVFGGNPAGVVIIPSEDAFPEEKTMLKTAAELRYSETAFVKPLTDGGFHLRFFTPVAEVDLCGHATIASFWTLLAEEGIPSGVHRCKTLAGQLEIEASHQSILMDMAAPQEGEVFAAEAQIDELYRVMGLSSHGQGSRVGGADLLPQLISTGLPDILMPVKNEAQLEAISPDFKALADLSRRYQAVGVHAFTINSADGHVHCRNFAPLYDIDEEAATGTSNGALTYYLYARGIAKPGQRIVFIQGEAMGRPSRIEGLVTLAAGKPRIQVGGSAVVLAAGDIRI